MSRQISAVAFDVFGTICGGTSSYGPYARMRDFFGIAQEDFRFAAMTMNVTFRELLSTLLNPQILEKNQEQLCSAELALRTDCRQIFLYQEAAELMHLLRRNNIPYGLISNLAKSYAAPVIEALGQAGVLPPKDLCLWSFEEGKLKPDTDFFIKFSERIQIKPENILMLGDKYDYDIQGARQAGFQARWLRRELPNASAPEPEKPITSLLEAATILDITIPLPRHAEERSRGRSKLIKP